MFLKIFQDFQQWKRTRALWLSFLTELEQNLESYYVMFQLGRLRFFKIEVWESAREIPEIAGDANVATYNAALTVYNQALEEFKEYEDWYSADVEHKSAETGKILHAKKEAAQQKFQGLEPIIKEARSSVKGQMERLRILKT